MKIQKRFSALFLAVVLLFSVSVTARAHETPDMTRTGSISVAMTYEGKAVAGGSLTLYRVGEIKEEDGNYSFALTGAYTECGLSLESESTSALAQSLAKYTSDNKLTGKEVSIGKDGKAAASGLELGLYLVVQTKAAADYEAVSPFLVSVPTNEDGIYSYDVDATPKISTLKEKEPKPSRPVTPPGSTLPQTGQLNWPVPVLTILGLCLFLFGFALRFGRKEIPYET